MAIYHLNQQLISKGQGRSIVAAAAYRSGSVLTEKITDSVTGLVSDMVHDYSKKENITYSKILAPSSSPSWVYDRELLWNTVTLCEKRKDAQYARELNLALPVELDLEQSIELMQSFVDECFVQRGMVADVNIHSEQGNPHAHILLTTRDINENGFGFKNREWNNKAFLLFTRELWAEKVNSSLKKLGIDQRVDHRSFKTIDFGLRATIHEGVANKIDGYTERVEINKQIRNDNAKTIIDNPEMVVDLVSFKYHIFSKAEVAKEVFNILEASDDYSSEQYLQPILGKIFGLECLVKIGNGELFISEEKYIVEKALFENIDKLSSSFTHKLDAGQVIATKAEEKEVFTDSSNKEAIKFLSSNSDLAILVGRAGTGKTSLIAQLAYLYTKNGYEIYGGAVSGIATDNLSKKLSGEFRTIASWKTLAENMQDFSLSKGGTKGVFILDEASMVDIADLKFLTDHVRSSGIKLVMVGDPDQLQPIGVGDGFRAIADKVGYFELEKIHRQNEKWQQAVTASLAGGNIKDAYEAYEENGCIHGQFLLRDQARSNLVKDYVDNYITNQNTGKAGSQHSSIILAYTREEVRMINAQVRDCLKQAGCLVEAENALYRTNAGVWELSQGEKIVFTKNNPDLGIYNGTSAVIEKLSPSNKDLHGKIVVRLEERENNTVRKITINTANYNNFSYGYATTIHKSQGLTTERTFLLAEQYMNHNSFYVAASRHREKLAIYWDKETFANKEEIIKCFERIHNERNLVHDYNINASNKIYYDKASEYRSTIDSVIRLYEQIYEKSLAKNISFSANPNYHEYLNLVRKRDSLAREIYDDYKAHYVFLRQFNIKKATVKRHAKIEPIPSMSKGSVLAKDDIVVSYLEHRKELSLIEKRLHEAKDLNISKLKEQQYELKQKIQEKAFYIYHNKHLLRKAANHTILEKHVEEFVSSARAQYRINTDEGYINKSSRRDLTLTQLYGVISNLAQKENPLFNNECQMLAMEFNDKLAELLKLKDELNLKMHRVNNQIALFDNEINNSIYICAFTTEYLSKIYYDPQAALDEWNKLITTVNSSNITKSELIYIEQLGQLILKDPTALGKIRGKAIWLFQDTTRKKAVLFAKTLAQKLERDRKAEINGRELTLTRQKLTQEANIGQLQKDLEVINHKLGWITENDRVLKEIAKIATGNIQVEKSAAGNNKNHDKNSSCIRNTSHSGQEKKIINYSALDKEINTAKNIIHNKEKQISKLQSINQSIESLGRKAYKENFEVITTNWNKLISQHGGSKAASFAQENPTLLGSLKGESQFLGIVEDSARQKAKQATISLIHELDQFATNKLKIASLEHDIRVVINRANKIDLSRLTLDEKLAKTNVNLLLTRNLRLSKEQVQNTVHEALYKSIKYSGGVEANKKHKELHHDLRHRSTMISNYIRYSNLSTHEIESNLCKYNERSNTEDKLYCLEIEEKISDFLEKKKTSNVNDTLDLRINFSDYSNMHKAASLYARLGARLGDERQVVPREDLINEELKKIYKSASAISKQLALKYISAENNHPSFTLTAKEILVEYMVNSGIKPNLYLKEIIIEVAKFQTNHTSLSDIVAKQLADTTLGMTKKDANLINNNHAEIVSYTKSRLSYQLFEQLAEKYPLNVNDSNNENYNNTLVHENDKHTDLSSLVGDQEVSNIVKNIAQDSMALIKEYNKETARIYIKCKTIDLT